MDFEQTTRSLCSKSKVRKPFFHLYHIYYKKHAHNYPKFSADLLTLTLRQWTVINLKIQPMKYELIILLLVLYFVPHLLPAWMADALRICHTESQ